MSTEIFSKPLRRTFFVADLRRYEDYNWLDERPRRGRPPKRLIEERRRERELLESQQAA